MVGHGFSNKKICPDNKVTSPFIRHVSELKLERFFLLYRDIAVPKVLAKHKSCKIHENREKILRHLYLTLLCFVLPFALL